jgi:hypothetical protein
MYHRCHSPFIVRLSSSRPGDNAARTRPVSDFPVMNGSLCGCRQRRGTATRTARRALAPPFGMILAQAKSTTDHGARGSPALVVGKEVRDMGDYSITHSGAPHTQDERAILLGIARGDPPGAGPRNYCPLSWILRAPDGSAVGGLLAGPCLELVQHRSALGGRALAWKGLRGPASARGRAGGGRVGVYARDAGNPRLPDARLLRAARLSRLWSAPRVPGGPHPLPHYQVAGGLYTHARLGIATQFAPPARLPKTGTNAGPNLSQFARRQPWSSEVMSSLGIILLRSDRPI